MKVCCSFLLFPLVVVSMFRFLPIYHPVVEKKVATLLESWDEDKLPIDTSSLTSLDQLVDWASEKLHVVNNGGHFGKYLSGEKQGNYFEGWYYKMVSENKLKSVIAIPGVFFEKDNNDNHGFIMTGIVEVDANGNVIRNEIVNKKFPLSEISYENYPGKEDRFKFRVGQSEFGNDYAKLNVPGLVVGDIYFTKTLELPSSLAFPNIMGFFGYINGIIEMQCVHKVVAIDSVLKGSIDFFPSADEKIQIDFDRGQGYIEGDYGKEFPSKYTWMQSNTFASNPGSSIMLSVAKVPLPNEQISLTIIDGFLGYIFDASRNKFYRFGTYTGATVEIANKNYKNSSSVSVEVRDLQYIYSFTAVGTRSTALVLWGPRKNEEGTLLMQRYVNEMLDAQVHVSIKRRSDGSIAFEGIGTNGGLEIELA